ncbi:hypothetical protein COL81_26965 [Bacillus toyonensis]|uniref:hypothetical protein n=1 Tax=Bacillus toyonensis TaxID=155322 RepID=UPI000BECF806|nr:hypothetical protein [Bacillus toyonensis]PEA33017.1 hypothetical protein COO13_12105 [Bacillus toyonensis]PGA33317.1 hypothetical protein COL81_26965 [Bacillus toyonensis]
MIGSIYWCETCGKGYEPGKRFSRSEEWSDEYFCTHECMRKKMKRNGIDIPPLEKKEEKPKKKWWQFKRG